MIVNITAAKGIYACISQYYFLSHQRVSFHLNAKRHIALLSFCPNGRSLILILFAFKLSMLYKSLTFYSFKISRFTSDEVIKHCFARTSGIMTIQAPTIQAGTQIIIIDTVALDIDFQCFRIWH